MDKLFVFDVDQVLLNMYQPLVAAYEKYIGRETSHQETLDNIRRFEEDPRPYMDFAMQFQHSPAFGSLGPMPGAVQLVADLAAAGFELAIVTAASSDPEIFEKRRQNLLNVFGDVFMHHHHTSLSSKEGSLKTLCAGYRQSFFIDDKPSHVNEAIGAAGTAIWLENPFFDFSRDTLSPRAVVAASLDDVRKICGI